MEIAPDIWLRCGACSAINAIAPLESGNGFKQRFRSLPWSVCPLRAVAVYYQMSWITAQKNTSNN
jgi:hypothetical protein